jgi:ubiquinone/menaquinone biosynthesis C-methylase UbiE
MKVDYDSLAKEYAQHRQVQPEVLRNLLEGSSLGRTSRVLEVGCGTGNYIIALEQATGCAGWGIDPSEQMLAKARERIHNAHLKPGEAEELEFPAEMFDMVFSVDVIHHVGDREAYFQEAYRVLKPGGKVCTVTDSEDIIRQRQPLSTYFPETVECELQRYPRIADLRRMMIQTGFGQLQEVAVKFTFPSSDIQIYRDKAFSCLHLISPEAFDRGIRRMEQDLRAGPIRVVSSYLLLWGTKDRNDD